VIIEGTKTSVFKNIFLLANKSTHIFLLDLLAAVNMIWSALPPRGKKSSPHGE